MRLFPVFLLSGICWIMIVIFEIQPCFASRLFSDYENDVMRAYISYYGRPADPGGLAYWADRLEKEGRGLSGIIQAFGESEEFVERYGGLSNKDLVTGIYRQLFGRNPDQGGLDYYNGELEAGKRTLQAIALDVLFGAQNEDAIIVENRLSAAKHFTEGVEKLIEPLDFDGDAVAAILAGVFEDAKSLDRSFRFLDDMLDGLESTVAKVCFVTRFSDSSDGSCDEDCSLREAVEEAGEIDGKTLVYLQSGIYGLNSQIVVFGNIHIRGAGIDKSIIDAGKNGRHFVVEDESTTFIISQLTLKNGDSDYGGAVLNTGRLVLDRVGIKENRALNGGGILNTGRFVGFGTVVDSNIAATIDENTGFGGGFHDTGGDYGLFSCNIANNDASFNGGGIYGQGKGVIINSVVTGNQSGGVGGGMDLMGPADILGTFLNSNQGDDGGGLAVRTEAAIVRVATSSFENNIANGIDAGGGGGAFNYLGRLSIADSTFTKNSAYGEGGGAIETNGYLEVSNVLFENNTAFMHDQTIPDSAPGFGGAILTIAGSVIQIENASFSDNTAENSGGAIYNDQNTSLYIAGSDFLRNGASGLFQHGGSGYGGAINTEGNLTVVASRFSENESEEAGGAIATKFGDIFIENSLFTDNIAGFGGAVVDYGNGGTLTVSGGGIRRNKARNMGGALHLTESSVAALTGVEISENQAETNGGAIYVTSGASAKIKGCAIRDNVLNSANSYGGAIHNEGLLQVGQSSLSGNRAGTAGGAISTQFGDIFIDDSLFTDNIAGFGGAVVDYGNGGTLTVSGGSIRRNKAHNLGGALHLAESSVAALTGLEISENQAETNGGAIYVTSGASAKIKGCAIRDNVLNSANSYGGAIHNEGLLQVGQSSLSGNRAGTAGGAIVNNHWNAVAEITETSISENSADNGAGVAAYQGKLTFTDCDILDNTSSASGGWGGGLLNDSADVSFTRVSIKGNSAFYGGGFSINGGTGKLTLTDSAVENNSAQDGSAFVNFGTLSLEHSVVSGTCNNHAILNDLGGNQISCNR